jgi:hypothetical protein
MAALEESLDLMVLEHASKVFDSDDEEDAPGPAMITSGRNRARTDEV